VKDVVYARTAELSLLFDSVTCLSVLIEDEMRMDERMTGCDVVSERQAGRVVQAMPECAEEGQRGNGG